MEGHLILTLNKSTLINAVYSRHIIEKKRFFHLVYQLLGNVVVFALIQMINERLIIKRNDL